jgi:acyl carrier protein
MTDQTAVRHAIPEPGRVAVDERIRELFATLLQVSPDVIHDGARPGTVVGWDSMQHLILVSGFEEEFGIDVDPEEAVDMYENFATFRRIVLEKLASQR